MKLVRKNSRIFDFVKHVSKKSNIVVSFKKVTIHLLKFVKIHANLCDPMADASIGKSRNVFLLKDQQTTIIVHAYFILCSVEFF